MEEYTENRCIRCLGDFRTSRGTKMNVCPACESPKTPGFPGVVEKVFVPHYGMENKSRLNEMDKAVILPINKPEGGQYVGTREGGKLREKEPNY